MLLNKLKLTAALTAGPGRRRHQRHRLRHPLAGHAGADREGNRRIHRVPVAHGKVDLPRPQITPEPAGCQAG